MAFLTWPIERGNSLLSQRRPRSRTHTERPAWARRAAVTAPPKPEPITTTSYFWRISERLQELEQILFVLRRQVRAVEVPRVAVAAHGGVVPPAEPLGLGPARGVAHGVEVIDIVGAIEDLRAPLGIEQRAQRRHRAVVEVGRAQPDAVERRVGVAAGLAEVGQLPRVAGAERVLLDGELGRERALALRIGADLGDGRHLADPLAAERVAVGAVPLPR